MSCSTQQKRTGSRLIDSPLRYPRSAHRRLVTSVSCSAVEGLVTLASDPRPNRVEQAVNLLRGASLHVRELDGRATHQADGTNTVRRCFADQEVM